MKTSPKKTQISPKKPTANAQNLSQNDQNAYQEQYYAQAQYSQQYPAQQQEDMRYKTELCKNYQKNGGCPYEDKCRFAHGKSDLKISQNMTEGPHYKSRDCQSFFQHGFCRYGQRCLFRHDERNIEEIYLDIKKLRKQHENKTQAKTIEQDNTESRFIQHFIQPQVQLPQPQLPPTTYPHQQQYLEELTENEFYQENPYISSNSISNDQHQNQGQQQQQQKQANDSEYDQEQKIIESFKPQFCDQISSQFYLEQAQTANFPEIEENQYIQTPYQQTQIQIQIGDKQTLKKPKLSADSFSVCDNESTEGESSIDYCA